MADSVADAAERMRGMSLNDVARDTTDFARRHPAAFLSGAALVGFAAARFLKASAVDDDPLYLTGPDGEPASRTTPAPSSEPIPSPATSTPSRPATSTPPRPATSATTASTPGTAATPSPSSPSSQGRDA